MNILQAIILGIVQGLTEFLPISSSAHLVIVPYLLGWRLETEQAFIFDVLVQVATLAAVMAYFWGDLYAIGRAWIAGLARGKPFEEGLSRLGWLLILASLPAGLFGLLVKDAVEAAFASPMATAASLLVTACLLVVAERIGKRSRNMNSLDWKDALWIGAAQALAIFPGISRSGATIAGAMARDMERPAAARFSFLMTVPIMLAAGAAAVKDLLELPGLTNSELGALVWTFLPGFLAAAVTGYLSIRWLLGFLTRHRLYGFAVYCVAIGALTLIVSLFR